MRRLHREGAFWVEVEKGSEQVATRGNIRISTIGGVSIKGAPGNQLSYSVVKRVKAGNEAQARRLLSAYSVRISRQGELTYLVVQGGSEMAELEVMAPQNRPHTLGRDPGHGRPVGQAGIEEGLRLDDPIGIRAAVSVAGPRGQRPRFGLSGRKCP